MGNWLTTHYPHPKTERTHWHIYLQEEFVKDGKIGAKIKDGDGVLFYELATNPLRNEQPAFSGRQGIVVAAEVDGSLVRRSPSLARDEKANGAQVNYSWEFHTRKEDPHGFVVKADVLRILRFSPKYKWMGFGGGSGIKKLEDDQYRQLLDLFHRGRRR